MKVLKFPLARITFFFIAGILLAYYAKPSVVVSFSAVVISFLVVLLNYHRFKKQVLQNASFGVAVFCLSFSIGISTYTIHNDFLDTNNYIHSIGSGSHVHSLEVVLREKLKSSQYNERYIAIVKQIDSRPCSGRILINLKKVDVKNIFFIGTNLKVNGKVFKHQKPNNPDQFDYGEYLTNKSVLAQMYAGNDDIQGGNLIEKDAFYYSDWLRTRILGNLAKHGFHRSELTVAGALILGQQQDIAADTLHDYQFAGAIHILSVSGLHVGFILLFLNFLLGYMPKNSATSYLKLGIIIIFLWGFAVLAGLSPSVIRSVTMFSFVAVGMHLKRKTNIFHTLFVSIFLILLFEPSFLFDVGFQLSYVALFFILWLQPLLSNIWKPKYAIVRYFWEILTVSFAAQIGTFPLSVYYFHQFPGLFFVTNLIIIPFLSVIMGLGVLVMIMATFDFVPEFLSKSLEWSISLLNNIINWIASFEQFIIRDISFNGYMLISLYVLIIAFLIWCEKPDFKKLSIAFTALIIFQLCYFGTRWSHQNDQEWVVFNSKKTTLVIERNGEDATVYTNGTPSDPSLKSYLIANFSHLNRARQLSNLAFFKEKKILLIDSLGYYPANACPDIVVMRQSPKINLDRMLQNCKPKMIIADATNFKSYVRCWEATCEKEKIPFHSTVEKGFYKLQ